jgi:hypothetical protein
VAKRWRKQKAGQQSTKHPRKAMKGSGDSSSAGGTLGGFRNFAKRLVGGGPKAKPKTKSTAARIIDIALWVAVAVAAYVLVSRQCLR